VHPTTAMLRTFPRSVARQSRSLRTACRTPQLLRPLSTTACRMAGSTLKAVDPPLSTALPGDSFQLLPEASKAGQAEDALFEKQVQAVKDWWASPRYKGIKRPYSAEDVVSKRGALQQTYPSSLMARKLFNLLEERAAKGEPVHTSASTLAPIASTMTDCVALNCSGCN
jgi:isocitrate lyase